MAIDEALIPFIEPGFLGFVLEVPPTPPETRSSLPNKASVEKITGSAIQQKTNSTANETRIVGTAVEKKIATAAAIGVSTYNSMKKVQTGLSIVNKQLDAQLGRETDTSITKNQTLVSQNSVGPVAILKDLKRTGSLTTPKSGLQMTKTKTNAPAVSTKVTVKVFPA